MRKTLITGGAGFIGYYLARNMVDYGYQVDLLDNFSRGVKDCFLSELLKKDSVHIIDYDLMNPEILCEVDKDYDIIFHFAAIIGVNHVLKDPYGVLVKNIKLLKNSILLSKAQRNLQRFVFASTSEVYAGTLKHFTMRIPTPEQTPITVKTLSEKRTSYMLSKIYGEALCHHSGLPFTIIRPHNFYGPRMGLSHVIPELFKKAYFTKNKSIEVFSADHKRTFCYITDAVEMIRLLIETSQAEGEIFNIGNQKPEIRIKELAKIIIEIVGKPLQQNHKEAIWDSPVRRCPDITKLQSVTGYTAKISLEEGLRKTYDWYKKYVFSNEVITAI
jgi:nucleoside-diphosphate-sugar epimerase